MNKNVRFYKCKTCGNIIGLINGNAAPLRCCGQSMELLEANVEDAAVEKHVPVYELVEDEIVVRVGNIEHPMEKEHYIMWIAQVTDNRTTRVQLYPEQATETRFPYIKGSTLYAYCNKHGLWKAEVE